MSKIESICEAIRSEAQTVISSTQSIDELLGRGEGKTADLLDEIRIDAVSHLQKLTLELATCFYEEHAKEQADEVNPEETSEEKEEV